MKAELWTTMNGSYQLIIRHEPYDSPQPETFDKEAFLKAIQEDNAALAVSMMINANLKEVEFL